MVEAVYKPLPLSLTSARADFVSPPIMRIVIVINGASLTAILLLTPRSLLFLLKQMRNCFSLS